MATDTRAPTSDFATGGTVAYSSGTTGWNLVNDYPETADPLTSYVRFGTTANSFIAFNFTAFSLPTGSTILSVSVQYTDEKPSGVANSAAARLRVNGTYYDATAHSVGLATATREDVWTTNPNTAAAWTVADVNGTGANPLQNFGVIGPDSTPVWHLGSIQISVNYTTGTTGTISATETGADTASLSGNVLVQGALAAAETGADTASLSGQVVVQGSIAAVEAGADTASIFGNVLVAGALTAAETGSDTAAFAGGVIVQGSLAATESGSDTAAFTGSGVSSAVTGTLAAVESGSDTASLSGNVLVEGALAATEVGSDMAAMASNVLVNGALAATESGSDTAALSGSIPVQGTLSATETGDDTAQFIGLFPPITGTLAATESGQDTASFAAISFAQYPLEGQTQARPIQGAAKVYPITAAQARPLTAAQQYPLARQVQHYPLKEAA